MFKIYAENWGNLYEEPWEIDEYDTLDEAKARRDEIAHAWPEWYVWVAKVD